MPIAYSVTKLRTDSASSNMSEGQNGQQKRVRSLTEEYLVSFDNTTVDANQLDPAAVLLLNNVPQVGGWSYYDAIHQKFYPNFTCRETSCERDGSNAHLFRVTAGYSDESNEENGQDVPATPEGYTPTTAWQLQSFDETCYTDNQNKGIMLPTKELYDGLSPVRKTPKLIAKIEQIESSFDEDTLVERGFKVNSNTWNGFGAGQCLITGIEYTKAKVPVSGTSGLIFTTAYKVNYTIECFDNSSDYRSLEDDGSYSTNNQVKHGYMLVRAGTKYYQNAGDVRPVLFRPNKNQAVPASVFLKEDGTKHPSNKQYGTPPIDMFVVQPEISFSFLR